MVCRSLQSGEGSVQLIDLHLSTMKALGAYVDDLSSFEYIKTNPDITKNGFSSVGIHLH